MRENHEDMMNSVNMEGEVVVTDPLRWRRLLKTSLSTSLGALAAFRKQTGRQTRAVLAQKERLIKKYKADGIVRRGTMGIDDPQLGTWCPIYGNF